MLLDNAKNPSNFKVLPSSEMTWNYIENHKQEGRPHFSMATDHCLQGSQRSYKQ